MVEGRPAALARLRPRASASSPPTRPPRPGTSCARSISAEHLRACALSSTTSARCPAGPRRGRQRAAVRRACGRSRAVKQKRAALARLALDPDLAAHQLGQLLADRQAEAGAAVLARGRGVGLLEGLEQLRASAPASGRCRCRAPRSAARSLFALARPVSTANDDLALLGELDRVVAAVDQHLAEPQRIADEAVGTSRRRRRTAAPAPCPSAFSRDQVGDVVQHVLELEVDRLDGQLAGLDLREVEDVVDDAEQVLAAPLDLLDVVALSRVEPVSAARGATCR